MWQSLSQHRASSLRLPWAYPCTSQCQCPHGGLERGTNGGYWEVTWGEVGVHVGHGAGGFVLDTGHRVSCALTHLFRGVRESESCKPK